VKIHFDAFGSMLMFLPLLLAGQTIAQTNKAAHSKVKVKKAVPDHPHVSQYMRHIALLYLDETDKLLKAHAAKDAETADMYEKTLTRLEQDINIDLDSDPCSVSCASTKDFVAAHANQSFFNLLQATKSLANVMSLNFGYDGSDTWQVSSPGTLTERDNALFGQYFSCKAIVDTAIQTGALIVNDDCLTPHR